MTLDDRFAIGLTCVQCSPKGLAGVILAYISGRLPANGDLILVKHGEGVNPGA